MSFTISLIVQSKKVSIILILWENHFNKELVITKVSHKDFENSTKYWICDNDFVDGDVKVRDPCHITGKHRGYARRYCNTNFKLNHIIPIVFQKLKNYDPYLITEKLGNFNFKVNAIPNRLENKWALASITSYVLLIASSF